MKLKSTLLFIFILIAFTAFTQEAKINIYNPDANAENDLSAAIKKAKAENKHVLVQVGGNWCSWCIRMHKIFSTDTKIDSILKKNYVFIKVNYSKENKNLDVLKKLEYPQRFGFPVLVVLNKDGKRIHTQDTGFLEIEKGYDNKKIITFLQQWTISALEPDKYKDK